MYSLTELVCGKPPSGSHIAEVLEHLSLTFDKLTARTLKLRHDDDDIDLGLFGPILSRALIEVAFTSLLGRLDPFRILLIREFQKQPSYILDKRNNIAVNWQADVQGEKVGDLFKPDLRLRDISRALLGSYYQETFWREAYQNLLDSIPVHRGGEWMTRLRLFEPETFAVRMRGETENVYTLSSKGIHHEFVVSPGAYYDKVTISNLLQRSFEIVGGISVTA